MRPWVKIVVIVLVIGFVGMQFIRPARNSSAQTRGKEISTQFPVPETVQHVLQHACYDCHSNNTRYPWYANVQPVGWFLNHHITEGKHELNFDAFASYPPRKQYHKFKSMERELQEGDMPLESYLLIHRDAKLSADQTAMLVAWSEAMQDSMKRHYPADSLERIGHR
jgi:hypothetical protein